MPNFKYQAVTQDGRLVRGSEAAPDLASLEDALKQQGLILSRARRQWSWRRPLKVGGSEFLLFVSELLSFLQAGITIPDAVALSSDRKENPEFGTALRTVHGFLLQGISFSEACTKVPGLFDRMWIRAVATGERAGDLISALQQYRAYYKRRLAIRSRVGQAAIYPALVLGLMAIIVVALVSFSLPRFAEIYANLRAELPLPTQFLLGLVDVGPVVLPGLVLLISALVVFVRNNPYWRHQAHRTALRLPLVGPLLATYQMAEFLRHMALLLRTGTPHVEALREVAKSLSNEVFSANIMRTADRVNEGSTLSRGLHATGLFPESALKVMEAGESSGSLELQMGYLAEHFEETLDLRLARVLAVFEPLLILLVGVLVGGVVIAMYLPIFSVAEVIP